MAINPDLSELRKEVTRLLQERRPDRYTARDHIDPDDELDDSDVTDTSWLDDIAKEVEHLVPAAEVRRRFARTEVGKLEGRATRLGNQLLRDVDQTGQLPLDWFDRKDHPISVINRVTRPGERTKVTEERVALRATSSHDLRMFAIEERRRAAGDFAARNSACAGAEWVADQMDEANAIDFATWAEQDNRTDDEDE